MKIEGSVALVTGASRGLGAAYARALLDRGAATVYAAVRSPAAITDPRLAPVRFDLTDRASIAAAARIASDATLVINNAGISTHTPILGDEHGLRAELEVNYLGPVAVSRSFAPVLAANGGGALVNVLSVLSWLSVPGLGGYSAAKAAMWSATNSLRLARCIPRSRRPSPPEPGSRWSAAVPPPARARGGRSRGGWAVAGLPHGSGGEDGSLA